MKTNAIIRIILFSLAILVLGSILLGVVAYETFSFRNETVTTSGWDGPLQVHSAVKASDIQHLEIEWAAGSITILPDSGSDQIIVQESVVPKEKYAMHVTQSGNKLKIEFTNEDTFYIGIGSNELDAKDLVIYVPADWVCSSLEIDAAAADVKVSCLTIDEVEFDGASGICTFEDCHIEKLDIDTASGDVNFTGSLGILDFDAMSAKFTGTLKVAPDRIDLDTMSGDLELYLPEDCGFTLSLEAMSSDFHSDFATNTQGNEYHYGDGRCRISVNAMSGDVAIYKLQ